MSNVIRLEARAKALEAKNPVANANIIRKIKRKIRNANK